MDTPDATERQPNVIVIIMDDLCWGDLACHGNPHTDTPNLDRLHGESARLTRYCSGPLCSPARASLMTGRYHPRTRVLDTYCGRSMIDPNEPTIAKSLSAAGYRTGAFGKWHLGDCYPTRAMDVGFEETLMHKGGGIGQPGDHWENYARWKTDSYFDPILYRNGKEEKSKGYCTDIFTDAAIEFIEDNKDKPFFVYLATNAPHTPLIIADEWADKYREKGLYENHARLYGMVENIDWNVGRILEKLDTLSLSDDTIVVYTSDHGPCGSALAHEAPEGKKQRYNAGLRGMKGTMYEGGIRVPCFWRWPGKFMDGADVPDISHPIDFLPTILAACGAQEPEDQIIDGVNLLPLLRGETESENHINRNIFMQWHRGNLPVPYKNYAVIGERYKLHRPSENAGDELYDIKNDPYETKDIAKDNPETVEQMRTLYDDWLNDIGATRGPDTFAPPEIILGTKHENPVLLTTNDWRLDEGQEGWCRNDLLGRWLVKLEEEGTYNITVMFEEKVPAGITKFSANDAEEEMHSQSGEKTVCFKDVRLRAGSGAVMAWRETDEPCEEAFRKRFFPPMYVITERIG